MGINTLVIPLTLPYAVCIPRAKIHPSTRELRDRSCTATREAVVVVFFVVALYVAAAIVSFLEQFAKHLLQL